MKGHLINQNRLFISFSGGRTSAYMTLKLIAMHKAKCDIADVRPPEKDRFVDSTRPDRALSLDVGASCGESCEIGADDEQTI